MPELPINPAAAYITALLLTGLYFPAFMLKPWPLLLFLVAWWVVLPLAISLGWIGTAFLIAGALLIVSFHAAVWGEPEQYDITQEDWNKQDDEY